MTPGEHNTERLHALLERWAYIERMRSGRPQTSGQSYALAALRNECAAVAGAPKGGLHHQLARSAWVVGQIMADLPGGRQQAVEELHDAARRGGAVDLDHALKTINGQLDHGAKHPRAEKAKVNGTAHADKAAAPLDEPEAAPSDEVATIDDLIRAGAEIRWLWPGWVQIGVLNILAAEGGKGKTRFCADLLRRIRGGGLWPDGAPITLPADSTALWVVADNNHDEMVTLCRDFGVTAGVRLNAWKKDPYGGVALDAPQDLKDFEARIKAVKPAFVVIDTVGNATDKNLSKQEDAKAFYQPLQIIARRQSVAIFCLTHLSAGGQVLGRRAKEKVRILLQLDQPDPSNEKRKLWISKSNSKYPQPLGVIMGDKGNEYDDKPPQGVEEGASKPSGKPSRLNEVAVWLREFLKAGPQRVLHTRQAGEKAGFDGKLLYRARDNGIIEEFEAQDKKWWRLTETE